MISARHIHIRHFIKHHKITSSTQLIRSVNTMSKQTMNSAIVNAWGEAPKYTQVDLPSPSDDEVPIKVVGSGLHSVVRTLASGTHYSSGALPYTPGVDGVGHRISDNKPVYFVSFPSGGFQEIINVPSRKIAELPEDVDPIQVAGYTNPAISSWMALTARTTLSQKFTVLIMGATSASGRVAVEVARALGAGKVIGAARNAQALSELGVDESIILNSEISSTDFSAAANVDIILDYIYGPATQHLLSTTKFARAVEYVHIGGLGGTEMILPGSVLRSQNLTIRGSGPGSWSHEALRAQVPAILNAFRSFKTQKVKVVPLSEIEQYWENKNERIVFTP